MPFCLWRNISLSMTFNIMCVIMITYIGITDSYWYILEPERLISSYTSLLWDEFDQNIFSRKANIWFEEKRLRIHYLSWGFFEQLCMLIIQSMFRNFKCNFFGFSCWNFFLVMPFSHRMLIFQNLTFPPWKGIYTNNLLTSFSSSPLTHTNWVFKVYAFFQNFLI